MDYALHVFVGLQYWWLVPLHCGSAVRYTHGSPDFQVLGSDESSARACAIPANVQILKSQADFAWAWWAASSARTLVMKVMARMLRVLCGDVTVDGGRDDAQYRWCKC